MHGSVEWRVGWSQSKVVLYNQTNVATYGDQLTRGTPWSEYTLYTFTCRSFTDLVIWRVRQCQSILFSDQYYIYYYSVYDLILNLIEWLGLKWLSVFNVGGHIWVWIIFYFYYIILFSRLIWDLGMYEGLSPLALGWYRESRELSFGPWLVQRVSRLLLYLFCH
jgi:hypothetical protein